jgi:hypothetical protein
MVDMVAIDLPTMNGNSSNNTALCFLTRRPNTCLVNIAQQIHEQIPTLSNNIYVMIDDDTYELNDKIVVSTNIQFLKVDKETCIEQGFKNSSLIHTNKTRLNRVGLPSIDTQVIAWDKAIYYFTRINSKYDFVWFIEEGKHLSCSQDDFFAPCLALLTNKVYEKTHPTVSCYVN